MASTIWSQRRLGERRGGPRYGSVRGRKHPPVVALDGEPELSQRQAVTDHRRCRRQQRIPSQAVEMGSCSSWPTKRVWKSRSVIFRPEPASGTRSNTVCSPSSARTGAGKPLVSHEVIINLIAATTSKTGLAVKSELDTNAYPAGIKISDEQMAELRLKRDAFHGDWNYGLLSRS